MVINTYHYKDGYAIWLVVRKDNKRKVMALGIYAEPHQWDDKQELFITDKRVPKLHPDCKYLNDWLIQKKSEILHIIAEFDKNKIDWTLNQFEQEFFHYSNKGNVKDYFEKLIQTYKDTNHVIKMPLVTIERFICLNYSMIIFQSGFFLKLTLSM